MEILRQYVFLIPVIVMILSEVAKLLVAYVKTGKWEPIIFHTGGMPSSHSAFVTSLMIVVERRLGAHSVEFAIAFALAAVVWYDAITLRREVGLQAEALNKLQHWNKFTEKVGHSVKEVLAGITFGTVVTYVGMLIS